MTRKLAMRLLPEWARPDHPILQYELAQLRGGASLPLRILQSLCLALILGGAGILIAGSWGVDSPAQSPLALIWRALYVPCLLLQAVTALLALGLGMGAVESERRRRTWDHLRLTELGAGLTLHARWITIIYRLRMPILAILLARGALLLGMVWELAALSGTYARWISADASPQLADWRIGLLLIALTMAALAALPLVIIAFFAALGMLISVLASDRTLALGLAALPGFAQVALASAALWTLISGVFIDGGGEWALLLAFSAYGDWGLQLSHLGSLAQIWKGVPGGALIGLGMAAALSLQLWLNDRMMQLAARLAQSRG